MTTESTKDQIFADRDPFAQKVGDTGRFTFNETVAAVFDDMVARSIPSYAQTQSITAEIAGEFLSAGGILYDLGCSTGNSIVSIAAHLERRHEVLREDNTDIKLFGIDASPSMIARARAKIRALTNFSAVTLIESDVLTYQFSNAQVVLCHYTLQFIAPSLRQDFLNMVCRSLGSGGALILAEKVEHRIPLVEDLLLKRYIDFKRTQGYSYSEITRKRAALEDVLIPFTLDENISLLRSAGFAAVDVVLKDLNFATLVAVKR
jgi:tRNA (cmo5U34)-methyltransferase